MSPGRPRRMAERVAYTTADPSMIPWSFSGKSGPEAGSGARVCSRNEPVYLPRLGHASIREPICGPASPVCFRARGSFPWAPKWALGDYPFRRLGSLWVAGERWRRGDKLQRLCGLVLQVPAHIGCKMCCLVSPLGGLGGRMVARAWVDGCCGRRRVAHNPMGALPVARPSREGWRNVADGGFAGYLSPCCARSGHPKAKTLLLTWLPPLERRAPTRANCRI